MKKTAQLMKPRKIRPNYLFFCFTALAMIAVMWPQMALACPLCVDSTPYKHGLQWAVLFLLPVPFVLAGALFFWIRRFSKLEDEQP